MAAAIAAMLSSAVPDTKKWKVRGALSLRMLNCLKFWNAWSSLLGDLKEHIHRHIQLPTSY